MYTQHEALARERMLEQRSSAAHRRLVRQISAGRRWQWIANYSAGRARSSQRRSAERSAGSYELAV